MYNRGMNERAKYLFGDIVVVDGQQIGIILKTWGNFKREKGKQIEPIGYYYEVYVREYNTIIKYEEVEIERYRVRHKYLSEEELGWQNN